MLCSIGKSFLYRAMAVVVIAVAGYALGAFGAWLLRQQDNSSYLKQRTMLTQHVMSDMGTLQVGEKLIDWTFEDVQSRPQRLSDLVDGTSIIMFIDPDCGACMQQFESIAKLVTKQTDWDRVVAISKGNPLHLLDLQALLGVRCPLLYDADGAYSSNLKVNTFPLSVIVDKEMRIGEVVAGGLLEVEIRKVFASNQ